MASSCDVFTVTLVALVNWLLPFSGCLQAAGGSKLAVIAVYPLVAPVPVASDTSAKGTRRVRFRK